ncbi:hypothetical protein Ac2012v2_001782 [Leucoagaricus gongylophorus]
MLERQKALLALGRVLDISKATFTILSDPTENTSSSLDAFDLSSLYRDFLSLLSLIYVSTTRLSLVLKPSSPSYTASLEPLKELSERIASLPHCVRFIQADHGKTLAAEAYAIARDVTEALRCLIQTFIHSENQNSSKSKDAATEYLTKTGALHDVIENAHGPSGFSENNFIAVRKVWKRNQDTLDDSLVEICEALENAEKPEGSMEDGIIFDDGWEEFGIPFVKPSASEFETMKKIYTIARLSTLFHQQILEDVLSALVASLPLSRETNEMLDELADASSNFLSSSDNLISTMYSPQDKKQISLELHEFRRQLLVLQSGIESFIPEGSIEEQLADLRLSKTTELTDHNTKLRKWCTTCVNQINKNALELAPELKG